jgi:hypothetical protein
MKKSKLFVLLLLILIAKSDLFSQGVAINNTGSQPDASAQLDVSSTTSGILIPRMTEIDRTLISNPATGLLVYQTDNTSGFYYWKGTSWVRLEGNFVEADGSTTNELNTGASWNNSTNTFSVTDAGGSKSAVITGFLESEVDGSTTNELQTISKSGSTVTLSNGGGSFTDAVNDADASATNELQNLGYTASTRTITISNGTNTQLPIASTSAPGLLSTLAGNTTQFLRADGTWATPPDNIGTGDITGVTAGNGLTGGGTSGTVTLSVGQGDDISVTSTSVGLSDYIDVIRIRASNSSGLQLQDDGGNYGLFIEDGGQVGVGTNTPSQELDVNGDIRLRGQIYDVNNSSGSNDQVLVRTSTGVDWQDQPHSSSNAVVGTIKWDAIGANLWSSGSFYTQSTITLPPGQWIVFISSLIRNVTTLSSSQAIWATLTLSDNTSSYGPSPDIIGGANVAGNLHGPSTYGMANGSILINNTSGSNKTYYLWGISFIAWGGPSVQLDNFGQTSGETKLFAVPVNN